MTYDLLKAACPNSCTGSPECTEARDLRAELRNRCVLLARPPPDFRRTARREGRSDLAEHAVSIHDCRVALLDRGARSLLSRAGGAFGKATADALRYIDNQWKALSRFVEDGRLKIDNNGAENQLRAVALGRKNWLFAGSMTGLHRAALLYSLAQSCRLVGVEPFAYFRDVLLRVATHPQKDISQLTPKGWTATFAPPAVAVTA